MKYRIVTNSKVFAIQKKVLWWWEWRLGESSLAALYECDFPKEYFVTLEDAKKKLHEIQNPKIEIEKELTWEVVE